MISAYFLEETGVVLDVRFLKLIEAFTEKFGEIEEGIETLGDYIGYSYLNREEDVRGYEGVPFELRLPFATGGDGEHMGWIDLYPQQPDFPKPFVTWTPMGGELYYHGSDIPTILQNLIRYLHEDDDYSEIDLAFLAELGVDPNKGNPDQSPINYLEGEANLLPIELDDSLHLAATLDGVGVLAVPELFDIGFQYDIHQSPADLLSLGQQRLATHPATALLIGKNLYHNMHFNYEMAELDPKLYPLTLQFLATAYAKMQLLDSVKWVNLELEKLK